MIFHQWTTADTLENGKTGIKPASHDTLSDVPLQLMDMNSIQHNKADEKRGLRIMG